MAWVRHRGVYQIVLTDGYVKTEGGHSEQPARTAGTFEQWMAKELYELASGADRPPNRSRPYPLDVWVVGRGGWIRSAPEVVRRLSEGEDSDNYRIVIYGMGPLTKGDSAWHPSWASWLRKAGIIRKKPHREPNTFKEAAHSLLGAMSQYQMTGCHPTRALEDLRLPFTFYGDSLTD